MVPFVGHSSVVHDLQMASNSSATDEYILERRYSMLKSMYNLYGGTVSTLHEFNIE